MQQAGYVTFMGGKWHLKGLPGDKGRGFDEHCLYGSLCDEAKRNKEWVARFKGPWWGKHYGGTPPGYPSFEWQPMIIRNGEFIETGPKDFGPDILSRDVIDFIRESPASLHFSFTMLRDLYMNRTVPCPIPKARPERPRRV